MLAFIPQAIGTIYRQYLSVECAPDMGGSASIAGFCYLENQKHELKYPSKFDIKFPSISAEPFHIQSVLGSVPRQLFRKTTKKLAVGKSLRTA